VNADSWQRKQESRMILDHPEFLASLPKTDLHLHLDGSLRMETIKALAAEQGISLPADSDERLRRSLVCGDNCNSLEEYLHAFDIPLSVLQEPDAMRRAAREVVEDAAAQNVRYTEVRFSPILHLKKGNSQRVILEAMVAGLAEGSAATGVDAGAIICGMRNLDPERSRDLAQLAVELKDRGVVAFDLAGAEQDYPAKHHVEAFYTILNNNVNCTCHAGEGFGPASISQAIHYCGAHRIGHGTRLHEDPDLMAYVNDHRIPLEICLTSNLHTGVVSRIEDHPFGLYYREGLRVTLNSDNTLVSDTTITREYAKAVEAFGLGIADVRKLVLNGFKSAFLPMKRKGALFTRVLDEMDGIISRTFGPRFVPPRDHF
jgi:adenosine deaminase